jgi:hypothetical protein
MKFLVTRKPRMGTGITPTAEMIRAHKEVVLSAVKRGEADCAYAFVGGGGFSIQNANSAEDLNQRLMSSPLGLFYDFEVRALTDYGKFMDTVAENFEKQQMTSRQMGTLYSSLYSSFAYQVGVFNATFNHLPPYTPAELDMVGQFYENNIQVTSPGNVIRDKQTTLNDFANTAPLTFAPDFPSLNVNLTSGIVKGSGSYSDTDNGNRPISFQFNYVQNAAGEWKVKGALARY